MKILKILTLLVLFTVPGIAQEIEIPESVVFAGLELNFTNSARKVLKTEVENLRRNPKYFQMKVERADLYFPLIEKVFEAEGFPSDFKFLALQESSLVPDAVSSSAAVGYWQFKKESGQEVGLRVDNEVDERMNIVASSRAAVKYLNRNNATLKNWIYSLLSYNLGLGGVKKEVDSKYIGATYMKIDDNMHWYVLRFLAHKFAFENEVGKTVPKMRLAEIQNCRNKSLAEIASESGLTEGEVVAYNKWLLKRTIPADREYIVVLPVKDNDKKAIAYVEKMGTVIPASVPEEQPEEKKPRFTLVRKQNEKGKEKESRGFNTPITTYNNRLKGLKAKDGDSFEKLAAGTGVKLEDFLLYNEVRKSDKVVPGTFYYAQAKRNKALTDEEHIVKTGETVWQISQQYGIRTGALRKKNKLKLKEEPKAGRVLLLRKKLKKGESIRYEKVETGAHQPAVPTVSETVPHTNTTEKPKPAIAEPVKKTEDDVKQQALSDEYIRLEDEAKTSVPVSADTAAFVLHMVQPGETLYSLSKKYNVKVDSISAWNNLGTQGLKASSQVIVGRKVKPAVVAETGEGNFIYHTVQPGETMYRIAKQYGKSVTDIQKWNDKSDFSVSVGEKLKIQP